MRALALLLVVALGAGCFGGDEGARATLVPYPRLGDVAVYDVTTFTDLARWENGVAMPGQVRLSVAQSAPVLDGARAVHDAYKVTREHAQAGVFDLHSELYVSPRHGSIVQSVYPLSQDQSIVAFDERGFPWLWGASALFGEDLAPGAQVAFTLPDNLGRGVELAFTWRVVGGDKGFTLLELEGPGANGSMWMESGVAWPARVRLTIGEELAPHVRLQNGAEMTVDATRASLVAGAEPVAPRDRGATFGSDELALRERWDGEKPPDGDLAAFDYPLSEAVRDAKLLDRPLVDWLNAHDAPILYRATYQREPGPVDGSRQAHWLLSWVDKQNEYYEVQIARVIPAPAASPGPAPVALPPLGVPVVESSGPAEPPADANHGWFAADEVPEKLVTLSEGMRVVREVFGAQELQIFLRSFADPPGYSYFIDGGFESEGRYTVVYHPGTGFIEQATGPVTPRLAVVGAEGSSPGPG